MQTVPEPIVNQLPQKPEPMHFSGCSQKPRPPIPETSEHEKHTEIDLGADNLFTIGDGDESNKIISPPNTETPVVWDTSAQPPKRTPRYCVAVALLDRFQAVYAVITEVFNSLSHDSLHWGEVMEFFYKVKAFVDVGSDKFFFYNQGESVASDAYLPGIEIAVEQFMEEWEGLRKVLVAEGAIVDFEGFSDAEEGEGIDDGGDDRVYSKYNENEEPQQPASFV